MGVVLCEVGFLLVGDVVGDICLVVVGGVVGCVFGWDWMVGCGYEFCEIVVCCFGGGDCEGFGDGDVVDWVFMIVECCGYVFVLLFFWG